METISLQAAAEICGYVGKFWTRTTHCCLGPATLEIHLRVLDLLLDKTRATSLTQLLLFSIYIYAELYMFFQCMV